VVATAGVGTTTTDRHLQEEAVMALRDEEATVAPLLVVEVDTDRHPVADLARMACEAGGRLRRVTNLAPVGLDPTTADQVRATATVAPLPVGRGPMTADQVRATAMVVLLPVARTRVAPWTWLRDILVQTTAQPLPSRPSLSSKAMRRTIRSVRACREPSLPHLFPAMYRP